MNYQLRPYTYTDKEFVYYVKKVVYKNYVEANWGEWNEEEQREMFETILQDRLSGKIFTEEPGGVQYTQSGVNQKMMDDTKKALKKIDETADKFIKTESGIAKKEKAKKNLAIGLLGAIGLVTAGTMLIKSGKVNKLVDSFKNLSHKTFADIEFN